MRTLTLPNQNPQFAATASVNKSLEAVSATIQRGFETLVTWQQRATARRKLAEIEPRLMIDAGINEDVVARETAKPFWRA